MNMMANAGSRYILNNPENINGGQLTVLVLSQAEYHNHICKLMNFAMLSKTTKRVQRD